MIYAEVVVNATIGRGATTFHYAVPPHLSVSVGHLVVVPFGPRQLQGVVVALHQQSPVDETRDILSLCDPEPLLTPAQVELARWLSEYYLCPLIEALRLFIPPDVQRRPYVVLEPGPASEQADLNLPEQALLHLLKRRKRLSLAQIKAELRVPAPEKIIRNLSQRGVIQRSWELSPARRVPQTRPEVRLRPDIDLNEALAELGRAPRQRASLLSISSWMEAAGEDGKLDSGGWAPLESVRFETGIDLPTLRLLLQKGFLEQRQAPLPRRSLGPFASQLEPEPALTHEQEIAWQPVQEAIRKGEHVVFLLHGVTGSGKTEIYLRAVREALDRGRQAIVLVPEIALTPQTLHRFANRFPGRVAVLHSQLSLPQRREEWRRLREGEADVVVGPRSALFAPLPSPGIIIVDEEHEWSYKQDESPRFHARDVALRLGELLAVPVLLGSATPDLSSYNRALLGHYELLELNQRVEIETTPSSARARLRKLPPVQVVNMRQEFTAGHVGLFSRPLLKAIGEALENKEQVILFLNRRGAATLIMCLDCGYVFRCRRCDVSLVYHSEIDQLVCHQCNRRAEAPDVCPQCRQGRLRYLGAGTQRVEEEVRQMFPRARIARWDRDAVRGREAYEEIIGRFSRHEVDILIGTQMIAKGFDLPLVTLVGVISGDTILHLPDFRAAERTFQLLTQVAGRAGRGPRGGHVILQTFSPEHYCIRAASQHDYRAFYEREMAFRRQHGYAPFSELARLVGSHTSEATIRSEGEQIAASLRLRVQQQGLPGIEVLGPAPRYIRRVRGRYRWQVIVQGRGLHSLLAGLSLPLGWAIDVDPVTTL